MDLKLSRDYNKERTEVNLYRLITADSINVKLVSAHQQTSHVILADIPITIKVLLTDINSNRLICSNS